MARKARICRTGSRFPIFGHFWVLAAGRNLFATFGQQTMRFAPCWVSRLTMSLLLMIAAGFLCFAGWRAAQALLDARPAAKERQRAMQTDRLRYGRIILHYLRLARRVRFSWA